MQLGQGACWPPCERGQPTNANPTPSSRCAEGKSAALVGESGSGKSTVIQLLLRLYHPCAGAVLLDDRDVATLPLSERRLPIGADLASRWTTRLT